ncbi:hypothetical protein KGY79_05680 [Candidatus Bipolaricaulota bacterium]|nr:hypothetical protein [Candidatus Bipolaricaulota bacterium]
MNQKKQVRCLPRKTVVTMIGPTDNHNSPWLVSPPVSCIIPTKEANTMKHTLWSKSAFLALLFCLLVASLITSPAMADEQKVTVHVNQ